MCFLIDNQPDLSLVVSSINIPCAWQRAGAGITRLPVVNDSGIPV